MQPVDVIRFDRLPVSRWRNGAGRKADIASTADWHVGFAWLDADAPFSDFSGQDRTITLVDGPGFVLDFPDRPPLHVAEPFRPAAFDGGWPTQCRLLGGPSLVLNAMTARARHHHIVEILPGDLAQDVAGAEACVLVLLKGEARVSAGGELGTLQPQDAIRTPPLISVRAEPASLFWRVTITTAASPFGEGPFNG